MRNIRGGQRLAWTRGISRGIPQFLLMADCAVTSTSPAMSTIPVERLPGHVGIIMDGNGRWAMQQGLPRQDGHKKGADAVREVVRSGRKLGLKALTLFAFSSQNWDRPAEEVFHLMQLLREYLLQEREEILENRIRLTTVGDTERLPAYVRDPLEALIAESAEHDGMILCLALSYGGRETIAGAAREACKAALAGELRPDDLTPERFAEFLPSSQRLPPLDLLIRTSGERRVSNFFLWEVAYAELFFTPRLWPEFTTADLMAAIQDFASRERRFGLTQDQIGETTVEHERTTSRDSGNTGVG